MAVVAVTMLAGSMSGCAGARGELTVDAAGADSAAVLFDAVPAPRDGTTVGDASVAEGGAARDAIGFVARDLLTGDPIDGVSLLGAGAALVTFVEPHCEFVDDQAALLTTPAVVDADVTVVVVHSGGTPDQFRRFAAASALLAPGIVHLDDSNAHLSRRFGVDAYPSTLLVDRLGRLSMTTGAMDAERLASALSILHGDENR